MNIGIAEFYLRKYIFHEGNVSERSLFADEKRFDADEK